MLVFWSGLIGVRPRESSSTLAPRSVPASHGLGVDMWAMPGPFQRVTDRSPLPILWLGFSRHQALAASRFVKSAESWAMPDRPQKITFAEMRDIGVRADCSPSIAISGTEAERL